MLESRTETFYNSPLSTAYMHGDPERTRKTGLLCCLALCLLFLDFLYDVENLAAAVIAASYAHSVRSAERGAV